MPSSKPAPARNSHPRLLSGSAEIEAMVARTVPAILDRYPKEDVIRTLMRLAVTGQLLETERRYSLEPAAEPNTGWVTRPLRDE
jgi:hypothetical protein